MRALATALLALVLLAPLAPAQEAPSQPANFLAYRPWPDTGGDPLASALAPPPFDAPRLPSTRIDRARTASSAPENAPESAPAHYREFQRLVQEAEATGTSVGLVVDGVVAPGALTIDVELFTTSPRAPTLVALSVVVFEHGVEARGRPQPYVARFVVAAENASVPGNSSRTIRLDPAWDLDRIGVVVIALGAESVENAATWLVRADAPTTQRTKAALVEQVSASWCDPCRPAEEAFALLALQRGAAGPLGGEGHASYLRAPSPWLYGGLLVGALAAAGIFLDRRRAA